MTRSRSLQSAAPIIEPTTAVTLPVTLPDEYVADAVVGRELGGVSPMSIWRWDRDPEMIALGWPPPVQIRKRKYRSRQKIEKFKAALEQKALQERGRKLRQPSQSEERPRVRERVRERVRHAR